MTAPSTPRPHILLLHCHDLGRHLHCLGAGTVRSPHLDGLAAQGIVLEGVFATAPQCSPSRSSLFTGRWPHVNGVMGLTHRGFAWDLNPAERHLAGMLREAGYRTELIGVQHEARWQDDRQIARRLGFDHAVTGGMAGPVADRTVDTLRRLAAGPEPFYLQVGFYEPHRLPGARDAPGITGFLGDHIEPDDVLGVAVPPYLRDDPSAREEIAELQGSIRHMDAAVGRVLGELDRLDLAHDTLVIFTTDHGLALPRAKCSLYDPGTEVALLLRYPARGWTGGRRERALLSNIDVVPTLTDLLGITSEGPPVHGTSFLPLLDREPFTPAGAVFTEMTYHDYYDPRRAVRTDRFKLIVNFSSAPGFMDPTQSWHRRCSAVEGHPHPNTESHPEVELYDLASDPLELADVADDPAYAEARATLTGALYAWMRDTGDPLLAGAVTGPQHHRSVAALLTHEGAPAPRTGTAGPRHGRTTEPRRSQ
ncbi:sulfatase [Streptomyces sp. NPDC004435]|uniref:sulfatase family protein n=1 Tax=Streptomyces sp. NPDC004435 TaxID=3364701 RepID=UPI0036AD4770